MLKDLHHRKMGLRTSILSTADKKGSVQTPRYKTIMHSILSKKVS